MKNKILFLAVLLAAAAVAVVFLKKAHPPAAPVPEAAAPQPAAEIPAAPSAPSPAGPDLSENSLVDQKADVFNLQGEVMILKKGKDTWEPVVKGTVIENGDQIKTSENSFVEIHYDAFFLNTARIAANSLAEFLSIEPTRIYISNGAIYNDLGGLPEGSTYDVITPTAVGGVRSTTFMRSFDAATESDNTVVANGTVYVVPGADSLTKAADSDIINVKPDEALSFSQAQVASGEVKSLAPQPASAEARESLKAVMAETKQNAAAFAGEDVLQKGRDSWQALKSDTKKMAEIKAKNEIAMFHQRYEKNAAPHPAAPVVPAPTAAAAAQPVPAQAPAAQPAQTAAQAQAPAEQKAADVPTGPTKEEMAVQGDVYDPEGKAVKRQ
ncbi:MAG TPA: hypothetical protein VL688_09160 [Verrucomicrobiae bacterium]|jgi:hypothetical protein|nr:hypothetical protein [Verrucomicrobiae bacterium]